MDDEESIKVLTKRQYLTVKSNDLIQKNRFELSLPEQKTVAYICSMIKQEAHCLKAMGSLQIDTII